MWQHSQQTILLDAFVANVPGLAQVQLPAQLSKDYPAAGF
jgi:hypothetical protein